MRTLKQIVEIIQEEYLHGEDFENGLCLVSFNLGCAKKITQEEHKLFTEYLWNWAEDNLHELWYRSDNSPKAFEKYKGYMWKYDNRDARVQWMEVTLFKLSL